MEITVKPIKVILTNASTFPYTFTIEHHGISAINTGAVPLVITLSNGIVISVPAGTPYEDYFKGFVTINATGSTSFQIGVR